MPPPLSPPAVIAAAVAGAWIDVAKTAPGDTSVWMLGADGADALVHVRVGADGRAHTDRRYFGRWSLGSADGEPALCFVRRPGRDAESCVAFALDTLQTPGAPPRRRLVLRGYAGQHHTSDRVLLARTAGGTAVGSAAGAAAVAPPPPAAGVATTSTVAGAPAAGTFHPRAVQPERPSVATHAGTVAPGYAEVESGVERDAPGDGSHLVSYPSLLKIGLGPRTQLGLQLPTVGATGTPYGLGDVAVALKWRVSEDHPRLQDVAILPQLKLPTGGARGTGTTDASLTVINSRTVGASSLDLNVGATWRTGNGTRAPRTSTLWAAAAGIPVRGMLGWALETYGYPGTHGPAGNAPIVAVLTGPTFAVSPEWELDFGTIVPLAGPQPHALYAGFVTNVGRIRR
ncbi:MAG TPA: transporter [Gemmatirosa sp.]